MSTTPDVHSHLDAEIAQAEQQLRAAQCRLRQLQEMKRQLLSADLIRQFGITRDQVQPSDVQGQMFSHVSQFADWLRGQPTPRRFAEWNGVLYFSAELIAGRFGPTAVYLSDLPS